MKEETNNEMDLLLRRLGRRPDISASDGNGDVDHLDADELNAYAENVLPAAARARYTEHLAECARCRELVVQLSSSAGVVPVAEASERLAPSGLRKFLASLFSPMVLRYAVPALGLIVVAAIGFFVLRQKQNEGSSIAQNAAQEKATSITTTQSPDQTAGAFNYSQTKPTAAAPQDSRSPENRPAAAAVPPSAGFVAGDVAKKAEEQPVTTEAPAAPKPSATPDQTEHQAKLDAVKETAQGRLASEPPAEKREEAAKVEDRKTAEAKTARSAPTENKSQAFGVGNAPGVAGARTRGQRDDAGEKDKDKEETEARTVAGRRFRKQNGIWVDTAYDFSRSPITYTRGSEPYRAFIADEPGVKTIADQLDGEILVLWKGRAYRIR